MKNIHIRKAWYVQNDTLKCNMEVFGLYIGLNGNDDAKENVILDEKSLKT